MKNHIVKLKQENMLCHRCVMNVVKTLCQIHGIEELKVDLESHSIKLKYNDTNITKEMIQALVQESIENGKAVILH